MPSEYIWIKARYAGSCKECETEIKEGEKVLYEPEFKRAYCRACGIELAGTE